MSKRLSRKEFLSIGAMGTAALLSSCDLLATDPSDTSDGRASRAADGTNGPEAPSLARLVKQGELPPVKQRLPDQPRVIDPVERVGQYGGTWRTALESTDPGWLYMTMRYDQHLVGWDPQWQKIVPFVAESFEVANGAREFTFSLRSGMKWSDGKPFTADDLVFWHDAVLTNSELTPVVGPEYGDDGKPMRVEKHDDQHVSFVFREPHGLFLHELAWFWTAFEMLAPRHYLEQFHPKYNPNVDELVAEAKVPDWVELFFQKQDWLNNPDLPTLTPWVPTRPFNDGRRMTWRRNPYYWSVDSEGSQLPYIDEVAFTFFNDPETLLLNAANGDIDMYMRAETTTPQNKPVLAQSAKTGGYSLVDVTTSDLNTMGLCLNLTNPNKARREVYRDKNFRIGLSHAINRPEIIDVVHQRQGRPWQTAPRPEVPFYESDDFGTQYTEFDLDLAGQYLDKTGFTERDKDGIRLGPDGEPIIVTVLTPSRYTLIVDALQMIKPTWEQVGVGLRIDNVDPTLVGDRLEANEYDCTADAGQLGYMDMIRDPRWLFASSGNSLYAPLWANWFTGATPQEEPPEAMLRQIGIYRDEVITKTSVEDMFEPMRRIIEIARDEFWSIGVSLPESYYAVVKDNFHNVPDDMWMAFMYPGVTHVSQYAIDQ
jgi:peptide/nickel transport system substrate-binding protein